MTRKVVKKNVWQMLKSSPYVQGSLVLDNGHLLVQVPKKKVFYGRELSTRNLGSYRGQDAVGIRRKRMSNFPSNKPFSRGNLQSRGHGKLSFHFVADHRTVETFFFAYLFLPISSVFTEQLQTCVKNMNPFTIDQDNLML